MKFIIFSKAYNKNIGGIILLHKLCHILNELGYESYLVPYFNTYELNRNNFFYNFRCFLKDEILRVFYKYKTNNNFKTPVFTQGYSSINKDYVVIYPEVVFGNPLNSTNVVRWLLHQPGFHFHKINYGSNELYFKYNDVINDFKFMNSVVSKKHLKIIHYPLDIYNMIGASTCRGGIAYTLRKGKRKVLPYNLDSAILIDGLPHDQVADILKKVSIFISFDLYTAYSTFAVLCGCDSVVVPEDNLSKEQWYCNKEDRYGIAYGFSDEELKNARSTAYLVKEHVINEEQKSIDNVKQFVAEVKDFFELNG